ncbi:MAG: hypothetical protein ACM359_15395 [Bacillota bacterium]
MTNTIHCRWSRYWTNTLCLCMGLMACGCVHDLSNQPPFSDSVGKTVELLSDCQLWKVTSNDWDGNGWCCRYVLLDKGDFEYAPPAHGNVIATLPAGTHVRINGAKGFWTWSGGPFYAIGEYTPTGQAEPVQFEYQWGSFRYLYPAPWEWGVPDARYVGMDGKAYRPPR